MFTIEHEFDSTVITLIDEVRQGSRPLFEDVVITAFDDRVVVAQASDDGDLLTAVVLSIEQLDELRAALNLPEGNYRIDRVSQPEEPFGIILVKSNETAIIRARQACETHKNEVVKGTPNLRRQNTSRPDP